MYSTSDTIIDSLTTVSTAELRHASGNKYT